MKVLLYMATTLNGLIAKDDDSAEFITPLEVQSYVTVVIEAGTLVIGRRTYEILSQQPEFQEFIKSNVKIVAISHTDFAVKDSSHRVAHSPKEALEILKDSEKIILAGGGSVNAAFLAENLVDELCIDIEPTLLGKGIPLFNDSDFERKLKLLDVKQLSEDEVQLHYQVIK